MKNKSPKLTSQQRAARKEGRAKLAVLKKAGLYKGDVRHAKIGSYQRKLIRENSDVIKGVARGIKLPKEEVKKLREAGGRVKHGRLIVEARKGEKIRFDKKTGRVTGARFVEGRRIRRDIHVGMGKSLESLPIAPKGKTYYYQAVFNPEGDDGRTPRFADREAFIRYIQPAYLDRNNPMAFDFLYDHIEIEEAEEGEEGDDDE